MNTSVFGKKSMNGQRPRVDRFVAPRELLPELSRRLHWRNEKECAVDVWHTKYLQQKKYANHLDEAFGLEPIKLEKRSKKEEDDCVQLWPCVPRKKRFLSSADSILDLPLYSLTEFPEILDWSDDILVAALGNRYHKWSYRTQNLISIGHTMSNVECCKFDPQGKLLIFGTDLRLAEIHDNALSKRITHVFCRCPSSGPYCSITALDWSPTGNSFITGCSHGTLVAYTRTGRIISCYYVLDGAALAVRVSPDARYVSAAALLHHLVLVLTWPSLKVYTVLSTDLTIKALTWHPWRSALLGVGGTSLSLNLSRVALWDVPKDEVRRRTLLRTGHILDTMLFSSRTGELVLSMWNRNMQTSESSSCAQLVVMSDADTMVDQWGEGKMGLDRVRAMIFSPDGTKLATATVDEDLIIWKFLPEDKKNKKNATKRFSAVPVYFDKATDGYCLR